MGVFLLRKSHAIPRLQSGAAKILKSCHSDILAKSVKYQYNKVEQDHVIAAQYVNAVPFSPFE